MVSRPVMALAGAAVCALLGLLLWALAFHVGAFQRADGDLLHAVGDWHATRGNRIAQRVASLANPLPYAALSVVVLLLALRTRGRLGAAVLLAVLLAANAVTQVLKPALAEARPFLHAGDHVDAASWPSGHATASATLALCAVLAAPAGMRWAAAGAGTAFALAVSVAVVRLGWHFPSDVAGGYAVAGCATCLGAAIPAVRRRDPTAARRHRWRLGTG